MTVYRKILIILILTSIAGAGFGQSAKKLRENQRRQFELNNYYISMNINALLTAYTGVIEFKLDSLSAIEPSASVRNHQLFLKSTLITTISQTAFHSDPLAAAIDSWAMCYQLINYFETSVCREEYGGACSVMQDVFSRYATNYENGLSQYINEEDRAAIAEFAGQYPVTDKYLNRRSIIFELSAWISEEELRLKTGLLNMNDLMRDVGNQLEYYSSIIPKQTMWQMDMRLGEFMQPDSLSTLLSEMQRLLNVSADLMEETDDMIRDNRDTLLANLDLQRRLTLSMMRQERIAAMETLTSERQAVLEAMRQERLEIQDFMEAQRMEVTKDMTTMSGGVLDHSADIGERLVDYVFLRVLILVAVSGIFVIAAIFVYKRL